MVAVTAQLSRTALVDVPTVLAARLSAALLLRYKIRSAWLVLGGVVFGALIHTLR